MTNEPPVPEEWIEAEVPKGQLPQHYAEHTLAASFIVRQIQEQERQKLPFLKRLFASPSSIFVPDERVMATIQEYVQPILNQAEDGGTIYFFNSPQENWGRLAGRMGYLVKKNQRTTYIHTVMES